MPNDPHYHGPKLLTWLTAVAVAALFVWAVVTGSGLSR